MLLPCQSNRIFKNTHVKLVILRIMSVLSASLCVMLLAGCFAFSEEGKELSTIGGDLILSGRSDGILNLDQELGSLIQHSCSKGTAAVYPVRGDIHSDIVTNSATHHLIIRGSKGDVVIRLQRQVQLHKYVVVEYFIPKKLRYFGGQWFVSR